MIWYAVNYKKLRRVIKTANSSWLKRAHQRTRQIAALGKYEETSAIWSEVKQHFMRIQNNKCIYCEAKYESAKINFDIEHYRPKGATKLWSHPRLAPATPIRFNPNGYYLLAYNLQNYAASCGHCNTDLKHDFFPIANNPVLTPSLYVSGYFSEEPYLLFPLGNQDQDNPEELITFEGVVPKANDKILSDQRKRLRAQITILFFELDTRDGLAEARSDIISQIFFLCDKIKNDPANKQMALNKLRFLLSKSSSHTNCARSFFRLCKSDFAKAQKLAEEAIDHIRRQK